MAGALHFQEIVCVFVRVLKHLLSFCRHLMMYLTVVTHAGVWLLCLC